MTTLAGPETENPFTFDETVSLALPDFFGFGRVETLIFRRLQHIPPHPERGSTLADPTATDRPPVRPEPLDRDHGLPEAAATPTTQTRRRLHPAR